MWLMGSTMTGIHLVGLNDMQVTQLSTTDDL